MRYVFIQASFEDSELKDIPIAKRCEVLEVTVSGYYAWVKRQRMPVKCKKVISDETVLRQAKIIRNEMKYTPGYRQMHALMRQRGVCIGVKRLRGVLRVKCSSPKSARIYYLIWPIFATQFGRFLPPDLAAPNHYAHFVSHYA